MKQFAENRIDRFDMERGDVLSIAREDAARLAALPVELLSPPIHALLRWFVGESAESVRKGLKDPRDLMVLNGLIEHQKVNAQRRGDFLAKQKEKSMIAKQMRDSAKVPRESRGSPADVPRERESERESERRSVSDKSSLSLRDSRPSPSALRAAKVCESSFHGNEQIPCISGMKDGEPIVSKYITAEEVRADIIGYLYDRMGAKESEPEKFRNALRKYRDDLGEEVFFDVVWSHIKSQTEAVGMYNMAKSENPADSYIVKDLKAKMQNALGNSGKMLFAALNAKKKDLGISQ